MKINLYTLKKPQVELFGISVPEFVYAKTQEDGFYTIGAVKEEEEECTLLGMVQFHTNVTRDGRYFVEVVYVYVTDEFRRDGIGSKLMDRVRKITKNCDVETMTALLPADDESDMDIESPVEEVGEFLDMLGFSKVESNLKMFGTILYEGYPDLSDADVVRYTKLLKL